jgi:hypothetical protein
MDDLKIRLTEEEIKCFQNLSESDSGKVLLKYLARLKNEIFNPKAVTRENFDARKEAVLLIEVLIEDKLRLTNKEEKNEVNEYQ